MDAFRPERWLDESGDFDSQAGPTIPFGLGTRGCYGRRLAYLEMRIVITLLIWNFELQSCPKEVSSYDTKETLTLKPQQCYVRLRQTGLADGEEAYEK
jgi:cytochrome P450